MTRTIRAVVDDLLIRPRPVICIDTCELLAAFQSLSQGQPDETPPIRARHVEALRQVNTRLAAASDTMLVVVTELVRHEWMQNVDGVKEKLQKFLDRADKTNEAIHDAWACLDSAVPPPPAKHGGRGLVDRLAGLAAAVLGQASILEQEPDCVGRALHRVYAKTRPSHNGLIKDSLNLEHYLQLARNLKSAGFGERVAFVSSNKSDFWTGKNDADVHPDIRGELSTAGLEFFGDLRSAVGSLLGT